MSHTNRLPTPLLTTALSLTVQDWNALSLDDPHDKATSPTADRDVLIERATALLLVRIIACVAPPGSFPDWGTSSICRTLLHREKLWTSSGLQGQLTDTVITQLRQFVKRMLKGYKKAKDVPYHSIEHAYHVLVSTNKLLDLILAPPKTSKETKKNSHKPPTFGLRSDPLALMAVVFAALIHDVEHQGIPNRQLSLENDRLAILYNDQSIAENWSLYVAFSELLQNDFTELRTVLFDEPSSRSEKYKVFRKIVVNLVLQTDIASPERSQLTKSKWKEAFGDIVTSTATAQAQKQLRERLRRLSLQGKDINVGSSNGRNINRRMTGESAYSEITMGDDDMGEASPNVTPDHSFGTDDHEEEVPQKQPASQTSEEKPVAAPTPTEPTATNTGSLPLGVQSAHVTMSRESSSIGISGGDRSLEDGGKLSLNDLLSATSHSVRRGKFDRRQSTNTAASSQRFRQRLGILRTIDLSGESLETYSRHESTAFSSYSSVVYTVADEEADEPDELKAMVVLETLLTAADVAHNLQSWQHMVKWSGRLYNELRKAHVEGRGPDVSKNWFENQIGFLESYLLPLARRLQDTGVFGEEVGAMFPRIVEDNRDQWLTDGYDISQSTIEAGAAQYPLKEEPKS